MRDTIVVVLLVLIAFVTALLILTLLLAGRTPSWWAPVNATDAGVAERALALENTATAVLNETPTNETWALEISESQANEWLAARLPRWLASMSDAPLSEDAELRIWFGDGELRCAARGLGASDRVLTASLRPQVDTGSRRLSMTGIRVGSGSLWMPGPVAANLVPDGVPSDPEVRDRILEAISSSSIELDNEIEIGDGKRIRLESIELRPGVLRVAATNL